MRHKTLRSSKPFRGWISTLTLTVAWGLLGSAGFTMAVNDLAGWVIVIAVAAIVATGWTEGRHIAATRRDLAALAGVVTPRRRPGDDDPQFY